MYIHKLQLKIDLTTKIVYLYIIYIFNIIKYIDKNLI